MANGCSISIKFLLKIEIGLSEKYAPTISTARLVNVSLHTGPIQEIDSSPMVSSFSGNSTSLTITSSSGSSCLESTNGRLKVPILVDEGNSLSNSVIISNNSS